MSYRVAILVLTALLIGSTLFVAGAQRPVNDADCLFLQNPSPFLERSEQREARRSAEIGRAIRWTITLDGVAEDGVPVHPNSIRRNNFIDDEVFTRMAAANIRSAPIAGDAMFLRRVTLDLTGRIPSATDVTDFLADTNRDKRNAVIDALIASPEFTDKWTMFFGDLFQNNATNTHVTRGIQGRDAFYLYLRQAIADNKPYDVIARELIAASGNTNAVGPANWPVGNTISNGPEQDTYDGAAVDLASMFMGINAVECLLCHDGARHLDQTNLWGASETRQNMWGLSAYFSRTTMAGEMVGGFSVSDNTTGAYRLNTREGNRTPRLPVGGMETVAPRYPFGKSGTGISSGENYREALARLLTADLQFSRAAVNYVWEKIMVEALVSPSDAFDLARLDPKNPPPAPWTIQPTNPQLLDRLAREFQNNGYNLRLLIGTIVKSNAYQLSSTYLGDWKASYVPYYARHYVRRLDAEEIHDAILKASGRTVNYSMLKPSKLPTVHWAMQLPDPSEPRYDSNLVGFLKTLGRGDRDVTPRSSDSSIAQGLLLMNNRFVTEKITVDVKPDDDPTLIIRQLFLRTMSRQPTEEEVEAVLPSFLVAPEPNPLAVPPSPGSFAQRPSANFFAAQNLQWVLFNRVQFLFNY
jgi:hypothetical protein